MSNLNPEVLHDPRVGRVLDGRYRLMSVLGEGGVGVVYKAEHTGLRRLVALKLLNEELGARAEFRLRFEREAKALSSLLHPHIVTITDFGTAEGVPYLAMEFVEGGTLADLLERNGPPEVETTIDILRQILDGLAFVHSKGVLHRDLKPANVFLQSLPGQPYHVKLLDFGLAKILSSPETGQGSEPTLTQFGAILGTPAYMAPEQAAGSRVDARADVYAAGVVLFEMLCGRAPFVAETRGLLLRAHVVDPVPAPNTVRPDLEVTPELEHLLMKALAKDPVDRFADATEMIAALDALPRPAAAVAGHTPTAVDAPALHLLRDGENERTTPRFAMPEMDDTVALESPAKKRTWLWMLFAVGLAMVGGGIAFFTLNDPAPEPPTHVKHANTETTSGPSRVPTKEPPTPEAIEPTTEPLAVPVLPPKEPSPAMVHEEKERPAARKDAREARPSSKKGSRDARPASRNAKRRRSH